MTARLRTVHLAKVLRLRDGRDLSWGEWGAPDGFPAVWFHGTPGSRVQAKPLDAVAARNGIRVIAIERPGYGYSTPARRRRLLDWPSDVEQVVDALGIDRFAVLGISGGGPHAFACAYAMADRVTTTFALSSAGPPGLDEPRDFDSRGDRVMGALMSALPELDVPLSAGLRWWLSRRDLHEWFDQKFEGFAEKIPDDDVALLRSEGAQSWIVDDAFENLRFGLTGQNTDGRVFKQPWGFDLRDVGCRVELWQGGADAQVPPGVGRRMADRLPDCTLHFHPEGGHLFTSQHTDEIMATARASFDEVPPRSQDAEGRMVDQ